MNRHGPPLAALSMCALASFPGVPGGKVKQEPTFLPGFFVGAYAASLRSQILDAGIHVILNLLPPVPLLGRKLRPLHLLT